jgi:hypothetical protein
MSLAARDVPFPADWTVRRARDAYLAENGFTVDAYDAPWTYGSFFGLRVKVPNTPKHRWAIMLHDLHHVATGFGTDLVGEGEISGFEIRKGWRSLGVYVGGIVLMGSFWGVCLAPLRTLAAFRAARHAKSLFALDPDYDELLEMTVGELRALLGLPRDGLARAPRRLHDRAPVPATTPS